MEQIEDDTKSFKEKVFSIKNPAEDCDIFNVVSGFFDELLKRRRGENQDNDDMQASILILSNGFAAKINENDGHGSHRQSFINLERYLNNKRPYYSYEETIDDNLVLKTMDEIIPLSTRISIWANNSNISLMIVSNNNALSSFELRVIKMILVICKKIADKEVNFNMYGGDIPTIELGMCAGNAYVEFENWSDKLFTSLQENLGNIRRRTL